MQTFNGDNCYNNCITIDYALKTVKFKPIVRSRFVNYFCFIGDFWLVSFGLGLLTVFAVLFLKGVVYAVTGYFPLGELDLAYGVLGVLINGLVISFFSSLLFFNKKWMKENYPKFNVYFSKFFGMAEITTLEITSDMVKKNKKFVIKEFGNVLFDFKCSKDFSFFLKKISITSIKKSAFNFKATIEWAKMPQEGVFKVRYW